MCYFPRVVTVFSFRYCINNNTNTTKMNHHSAFSHHRIAAQINDVLRNFYIKKTLKTNNYLCVAALSILDFQVYEEHEMHHFSCSEDKPSVQAKGSLMCFMFRYFLDTVFETCFRRYGTVESFPAMFWEYFDAARRLGNSAGSTSEVMLADKLTRS